MTTQTITRTEAETTLKNITNGKIFTVTFVKRTNGEIRRLNCRKGVRKYANGQGLRFNPASKGLLGVFDMKVHDYRFIALESILSLSMQGQRFVVA